MGNAGEGARRGQQPDGPAYPVAGALGPAAGQRARAGLPDRRGSRTAEHLGTQSVRRRHARVDAALDGPVTAKLCKMAM